MGWTRHTLMARAVFLGQRSGCSARANRNRRQHAERTRLSRTTPQTRDEIVEALTDHGCAVDTAQTGRDGLMLAIANAYDAIVLDRMLPRWPGGLGMLASLRSAGVAHRRC